MERYIFYLRTYTYSNNGGRRDNRFFQVGASNNTVLEAFSYDLIIVDFSQAFLKDLTGYVLEGIHQQRIKQIPLL